MSIDGRDDRERSTGFTSCRSWRFGGDPKTMLSEVRLMGNAI
jgi:hypothetical protein